MPTTTKVSCVALYIHGGGGGFEAPSKLSIPYASTTKQYI